jgi:hypothetical protein
MEGRYANLSRRNKEKREVAWNETKWKKVERAVFKLQKRIIKLLEETETSQRELIRGRWIYFTAIGSSICPEYLDRVLGDDRWLSWRVKGLNETIASRRNEW